MIGGFRLIDLSGVNFRLDLVVLLQTAGQNGFLTGKQATLEQARKKGPTLLRPTVCLLSCDRSAYASWAQAQATDTEAT